MKRIKTLRSHTAHARWIAECDWGTDDDMKIAGYLPSHLMPMRPRYHSAPCFAAFVWRGQPHLTIETSHRCYEVWQIDADALCATDEEATDKYITQRRA
jgi:hypothetical protein